jgi:hypothetical protein
MVEAIIFSPEHGGGNLDMVEATWTWWRLIF